MKKIALLILLSLILFPLIRLADYGYYYWYSHNLIYHAMEPNLNSDFALPESHVVYKLSSIGLNNPEVKIPKPKETLRILAIGDSVTFGWGVPQEDSWPKQLEKKLNDSGQLAYKVEIINAGIPGTSPSDYSQVCDFYYNQLGVDYIIYSFFSNDFYDEGTLASNPKTFIDTIKQLFIPHLSSIRKGSAQIRNIPKDSLNDSWKQLGHQYLTKTNGNILNNLAAEAKKYFLEGKINPGFVDLASIDPSYYQAGEQEDNVTGVLPNVKKAVSDTIYRCGGPQHLLGFIYIPSMVLIKTDYFAKQKELGFDIPDWLTSSNVSDKYFKDSSQNLAPYYSFVEDFRGDGCPDCYFLWDTHLTKIGNQRVAASLTSKIITRLKEFKSK